MQAVRGRRPRFRDTADPPGRAARRFQAALAQRPAEVRRVAGLLCDLVRSVAPGASQHFVPGWQALAFRDRAEFCFIRPRNTGVTLGFYRGDRLPDPERVLCGFAKRIRFVRIRTPEDLETAHIAHLISSALVVSAAEAVAFPTC